MIDISDRIMLEHFGLFNGLSDEYKNNLWKLCERKIIKKGEEIIQKGQEGKEMFLIESGEFDVLDRDGDKEFLLNKISRGASVGVMALIESGKSTATLRASKDSVVYRLPFDAFDTAFGDTKNTPYATIMRNQLLQNINFLSEANNKTVSSLKNELAAAKKRLGFGRFVAFLLGSVTLYAFLLRMLLGTLQGKVDSTWISVSVLVACLMLYIPMMKFSGFSWATYGLTLKNWWPSLVESLWWTAIFLGVVTLLKLIGLWTIPSWKAAPLFSMYGFTRYESIGTALMLIGIYTVFAPVQELIARGAMQSSLHEFLAGKYATFWAIVLSTFMFTQTHLHLTPAYALSALIASLFWGVLYARQRTLLGVSVSHILIGIYVAFFLGLPIMEHP